MRMLPLLKISKTQKTKNMIKEKDLLTVKQAMLESDIDSSKVQEVISKLMPPEENEVDDAPPSVKKEFLVLASTEGSTPIPDDLVVWVAQVLEGTDPNLLVSMISDCAHDYNMTRKGRKSPVRTIGEAIEVVSGSITREHGVWLKTKEPVRLMTTDNSLLPRLSAE
jgi:hypothetical protein